MISAINQITELDVLLNFIVANYFGNLYCTCILWRITGQSSNSGNSVPILNYAFHHQQPDSATAFSMDSHLVFVPQIWLNYDVNGTQLRTTLTSAIDAGCQSWIVEAEIAVKFLENYWEAVDRLAEQRRPRVRFVFPIPAFNRGRSAADDATLHSIMVHPGLADVPDVLLIAASRDAPSFHFDLITSQFVGRDLPPVTTPLILDSAFVDVDGLQLRSGSNLFNDDKLRNLQGRHLTLALFNYKPYTTVTSVPPGTGNADHLQEYKRNSSDYQGQDLLVAGSEGLVFLEFCKRVNCTLLISWDDEGQWGEIYDNWTGNGLLGAVLEKEAEVGVGAIYSWYHEYTFLSYSMPITRTGVTSLVPKPHVVSPLLIAVLPFSATLWIMVFVSYLVSVASQTLVHKCYSKIHNLHENGDNLYVKSTFLVMGCYVLQPINYWPMSTTKRILLASLLINCLVIGFSFTGGLASIMTVPQFEPPIDTPEQLAASGITWSATHDAWIFSIREATEPVTKKIVSQFKIHTKSELTTPVKFNVKGFAVERLPYGYFAFGDYITQNRMEDLHVMREDIYFENCVAVSARAWYLRPQFDELVLQIAQSGVQKYWLTREVYQLLDPAVQRAFTTTAVHDHDAEQRGPERLTFTHVQGIFYVLLFGLFVSSFALIIELARAKVMKMITRRK